MQIEKIWLEKLEKSKYKNLENFLKEFSSDEYKYTREMLLDDIHFYIDELLGYNDFEEPKTVADDDAEFEMIGW